VWAALTRVISDQLGGVVLDHLAAVAGGAFQRRVVNHHQLAVARQVQVQLATMHTVLQAFLEAGQGIFRCFAFGPAMAIDQGHGCSFTGMVARG
jgi:hypothetical protein